MLKLLTPSKDQIALLPEFTRLSLQDISVVANAEQAALASKELLKHKAWGFDTESKPTFVKDEKSDGPHVLQLATPSHAYVIQLHDPECRAVAASLLAAPGIVKAGFGLRDDKRHILRKLGIEVEGLLDLNHSLHERGYRKEVGVKDAIGALFAQRFIKSKKVATTNWAAPSLSDAQVIYAANDAYAAICVYLKLTLATTTDSNR